jgi:hypothetical protein
MSEETERLITTKEIENLDKLSNTPIIDKEDLIELSKGFYEDE